MRLIHISDLHFDERRQLAGAPRLDGRGHNVCLVSLAACIEHVRVTALAAGRVDAWIVTGDVFDTATPSPLEERYAIEAMKALAKDALVIIIAGNHDVPNAAAGATALECLKHRDGIIVVEDVRNLAFWYDPGGSGRLFFGGGLPVDSDRYQSPPDLVLSCVPYPRRAELVRGAPEAGREARNALASELLRGLVQALRIEAESRAPDAIRVALFHGSLDGAKIGVQPRALSGDVQLAASDFAGYDAAACGHIHKMQPIGPGVYYAGSPDRCDFDEERDYKGGVELTVERGKPAGVKPIPTPAREYVTVTPEQLLGTPPAAWKRGGAVYRVKGDATPEVAIVLRRRVADLDAEGVWISTSALKVESETRARDAGATADESTSNVLERWLAANELHLRDLVEQHGGEPLDDLPEPERAEVLDVRRAELHAELLADNHAVTGE